MKKIISLVTFTLFSIVTHGQDIHLTDNLIYPRLDTNWQKDYDNLNKVYSRIANRCQTCVFQQTDSTRGRFCFHTTLGHVQMDTILNDFPIDKLIGKWEIKQSGLFEVTDSLLMEFKVGYRDTKMIKIQKNAQGIYLFTDKRIKMDTKNLEDIPNVNRRYKIENGRFLTIRTLSGFCGATIMGLTKEGYLILDAHTLRTQSKKEKYLVVKTRIRRVILSKSVPN